MEDTFEEIDDTKYNINSSEILDRVRDVVDVDNDLKLAKILEISQQTIKNWRLRNNADIGLLVNKIKRINPKLTEFISLNWLIFGETPKYSLEYLKEIISSLDKLEKEREEINKEKQDIDITIFKLINQYVEEQQSKI